MKPRILVPFIACLLFITLACNSCGGADVGVHVTSFLDANGNGVLDEGETPVPGVVVASPNSEPGSVTTDASGKASYQWSGSCSSTGWIDTATTGDVAVPFTVTPPSGMVLTKTSGGSMYCGLTGNGTQDTDLFIGLAYTSTTASDEATASPTVSPTAASTSTLTPTATSAPTETATATTTAAASAEVTISADQLACRYGPGSPYLYQYGLYKGNEVTLVGRYNTAFGTWVYVKYKDDPRPCWVNPQFLDLGGADISTLPVYYPDQAPLILFNDPAYVPSRFWPPTDVIADRYGNLVQMNWAGLVLATGDRESDTSPRFLVEAWTCIGGQITFTPIGVGADFQGKDMSKATFGAQVEDDAGCSEPSHAQVYLAHKDGYVGPVQIPWPQQ